METRSRFRTRRPALIVATLAAITVAGLMAPSAAAATAPAVYSVRTGASVVLPDAAGVYATVASLALPMGSWSIAANATVIDFHAGDFVRCRLDKGGVGFDGGSTSYLEDTVADLSNSGVVKATAPVTVSLMCGHDHAASTAGQFYVDPGATIMAAAADGKIVGPAAAATATTVVEQRSTAQAPLNPTSATTVTSVRVGPGTWALRANLSAVTFGGFDFVNCFLGAGPNLLSAQQVVVGNSDAIVSNLSLQGVHSSATKATVTLSCTTAYTTSVYIDIGATLTATLVPTPANVVAPQVGGATLSDTGGAQTKVFHERLPAGAWRISSTMTTDVTNPNNSIGGATDFVRCTLLAGATSIDGGATVLINADDSAQDGGNFEQMIINSGTHTAKKPWTLTLSCSHDATISTGQHWQVFDQGPILAIQQGPIKATVS